MRPLLNPFIGDKLIVISLYLLYPEMSLVFNGNRERKQLRGESLLFFHPDPLCFVFIHRIRLPATWPPDRYQDRTSLAPHCVWCSAGVTDKQTMIYQDTPRCVGRQ
jgi:hypothetical protein